MFEIAPSILSADFCGLGAQLDIIKNAGARYIHIDVMDGHFVPNISIGIPVVKSIRAHSDLILDVHLMIDRPEKYVKQFASAGSDIINFHIEACEEPNKLIAEIKSLGKKAAITVKPGTPVESVYPYVSELDMVLIMSVEPGFGGQKFMLSALDKARKLRSFIDKNNLTVDIEMDGGIDLTNVEEVIESGANIIVAGSSVFGTESIGSAVKEFLRIGRG